MRGGIAERGGVRVGHRIIEINGQSVVATPHEKIVHILSNAVGEVGVGSRPGVLWCPSPHARPCPDQAVQEVSFPTLNIPQSEQTRF